MPLTTNATAPAVHASAGHTPSTAPQTESSCVTISLATCRTDMRCTERLDLPQPLVSAPEGGSLTIFTAACCTGMLCAKRFPEAVDPRLGGLRMPRAPGPAATDAAMGTAEATVDRGEGTPSMLLVDRPSAVQESNTQQAASSTDRHSTLLKRGGGPCRW